MGIEERLNGSFEFACTSMRSAFDGSLSKQSEPPLNLIDPGAIGGCEVKVIPRMLYKPPLCFR